MVFSSPHSHGPEALLFASTLLACRAASSAFALEELAECMGKGNARLSMVALLFLDDYRGRRVTIGFNFFTERHVSELDPQFPCHDARFQGRHTGQGLPDVCLIIFIIASDVAGRAPLHTSD